MGLRTESGIIYQIDKALWKLRENMLYGDIEDINAGIIQLKGNKLSKMFYLLNIVSSYNSEESIEMHELLIKHKLDFIELRRKHREQIHEMNVKFNNIREKKK